MRLVGLVTAVGLGNLPGFLIPFLVHHRMSSSSADSFLLVTSTAVAVSAITTMTFETAWAASAGRSLAAGAGVSRVIARYGARQAALVGVLITLVLGPLILGIYSAIRPNSVGVLFGLGGCLALTPILASAASVYGGIAIAQDKILLTTGLQGAKSVIPAVLLAATPGIWPWLLAASYTAGEGLRLIILCKRSEFVGADKEVDSHAPRLRDLVSHASSMTVVMSSPVIDRSFIASFPAGSVANLEIAERIYFAFYQIAVTLSVTRRTSTWSRRLAEPDRVASAVRGIQRRLLAEAALVAAIGAAGVLVVVSLGTEWVPPSSLIWSIVLLAGLIPGVAQMGTTRLVVMQQQARILPFLAIIAVVLNLVLNMLGVAIAGPIGVVVSTTVTRLLVWLITTLWFLRSIRTKSI